MSTNFEPQEYVIFAQSTTKENKVINSIQRRLTKQDTVSIEGGGSKPKGYQIIQAFISTKKNRIKKQINKSTSVKVHAKT